MNKELFGKFQRNALPERIAARILDLISEKKLLPGDRLPPERELVEMMQVSRPSLREALRALAMMNVIEIRQGSGTYVSSLQPDLLVEHLEFIYRLDNSTFLQLLEARKCLEVSLIALAIDRITDQEIARLEECLERSIRSIDDKHAVLEADLELHGTIAEATRNPIINRLYVSLVRLGRASRLRTVGIPGVARQTIEDHRVIVEAIKARDVQAAQQAMKEHLERIEVVLRTMPMPEDSSSRFEGVETDSMTDALNWRTSS